MFYIKLQLRNGEEVNIDLELNSSSKQIELSHEAVHDIKGHMRCILEKAGEQTLVLEGLDNK